MGTPYALRYGVSTRIRRVSRIRRSFCNIAYTDWKCAGVKVSMIGLQRSE